MSLPKPYYEDDFVTLYHGDCRELLPFVSADVLVTDPPYGMAFISGMAGSHSGERVRGDDDTAGRDAAIEIWGDQPALVMGRWSIPRPAATRMVLTWEKGNHVGMGDLALPWKPNTEEIYVLGRGFQGHRGSSVLRHLAVAGCIGTRNTGMRDHTTEKPVPLMADLVGKCPPGAVVDPFAGSGTTLRAAKDLGRKAIGIEIEEKYCEVAALRCAQETLGFVA